MKTKKFSYIFLIAVFLLTSCQNKKSITVQNTTSMNRPQEVLVLSRDTIEKYYPCSDTTLLPVIKIGDSYVPQQIDDTNLDGKWDELAFMLNMKPNEKVSLSLSYITSSEYPKFEDKTRVRLAVKKKNITKENDDHDGNYEEVTDYEAIKYDQPFNVIAQAESVTCENDKICFRNYFDCRNEKDLFGKIIPDLMVDKIGLPSMGSYHKLSYWGMDALHGGSSLGCGGLAMLENDSLVRLGCTEKYHYNKICEGPVRAMFVLTYGGWHVNGQDLAAKERISITPGKYWFKSTVTVSGFKGEKQLAVGMANHNLKNDPFTFDASDSYKAHGTLDKQSLNNDTLGMAILMKKDKVTKIGRTPDTDYFAAGDRAIPSKQFSQAVNSSCYMAQSIKADVPSNHYFFAVWGLEDSRWNSLKNFKDYISQEAYKIENPLIIKFKK